TQGRSLFERLLGESHFLILPSRADCVPVVISEASALGVPVITSNVGGISTVVKPGSNGAMFSLETIVQAACYFIRTMVEDRAIYEQLALAAFDLYENRLNWGVAGRKVRDLLEEICG